jgi:Fatty acid hydroxylase
MDMITGFWGVSTILSSNYLASSLNVLFFYLTWATLVLSYPPLQIELVGSLAVRVVFYWIPTLVFTVVEGLFPGPTSGWKIRKGQHVPGRDKFWIAVSGVTNHLIIVTAVQGLIQLTFTRLLHRGPIFNISTTLPMPWTILKHVLTILTIRGLTTYLLHRYILHNPLSRLSSFHGQHHKHSESPSFALKAASTHPLDFLLLQCLPLYLPSYILQIHLLTFFLLLAITSLEGAATYCGYDFGGIVGGATRRVDRHYARGGEGKDFGVWGPWDWILGTAGKGARRSVGNGKEGRRRRNR